MPYSIMWEDDTGYIYFMYIEQQLMSTRLVLVMFIELKKLNLSKCISQKIGFGMHKQEIRL